VPDLTPDVVLRPLVAADAGDLLALERRNRRHWHASGPLRDDAWFTLATQRRRLEAEALDRAQGRGLAFGIFAGGALAGRLALGSIVRGAFRNTYLGYGVDEAKSGRGIGSAAVSQAVDVAWDAGLHRVQAAVAPSNAASQRVLAKAGFRREGLARRYLLLAGSWCDQELWAITVEDRRPG
jgi:ribosomal-protein-alanine N-acetyltransferase